MNIRDIVFRAGYMVVHRDVGAPRRHSMADLIAQAQALRCILAQVLIC